MSPPNTQPPTLGVPPPATQPAAAPPPPAKERGVDLEIKDAQLIFNSVWAELLAERGENNLVFPREIFWLNGAPGAGKGTQTRFIMEYCGLTAPPVVISDLLNSPEARRLKDAGMMVGDREATGLLFRELLEPHNATGVVVDGFPRTKVQVECLKLFYQHLMALRTKYFGTRHESQFHKPVFHIIVLYVDEAVSVQRQLQRGRMALENNRLVESTGTGRLVEVRVTDLTVDAARNRYRTFKEITYESLTTLRQIFHYHFLNAQQSIEEVQQQIIAELKYQSSLELDQQTHDLIARVPIASAIIVHARQDLVSRLDVYAARHRDLFSRVIDLIEQKMMPIVLCHAISGRAYVSTEDPVFEDPLALAMLIDVFSERGYYAAIDIRQEEIPERFDVATGQIFTRRKKVFRVSILFQGSVIRRG
jgi:adenylate kinase